MEEEKNRIEFDHKIFSFILGRRILLTRDIAMFIGKKIVKVLL